MVSVSLAWHSWSAQVMLGVTDGETEAGSGLLTL